MYLYEIITRLAKLTSPTKPLYLVGGAVRDFLLTNPCNDFDLVYPGDPRHIAMELANTLQGDFYVMDEERNTCRVLANLPEMKRMVVDFAAMRGADIQEDLGRRDFTINAMAVDLAKPGVVIDPYKGARDLQLRWLRPVTAASFEDDPLRTIRAVRYAVALKLKMEPGTVKLIEESVKGLTEISSERKRDELFKIFSGERIHAGLHLLDKFCILQYLPIYLEGDVKNTVRLVRALEDILDWISGRTPLHQQAAFYQSSLLATLGRFKENLKVHYFEKNQSRRDHRSLLFLTVILMASANPELSLRKLALSQEEMHQVNTFRFEHPVLSAWIANRVIPQPVALYKFFKTTGSIGIDLVISALAAYALKPGSEFSQEHWLYLLCLAENVMEAWFNKPEWINPVPLVNGDEIMYKFSLTPGPLIGELLSKLKEDQVRGEVTTVDEAFAWLSEKLQAKKEP